MAKKENLEEQQNKSIFRVTKFSRRQFIKSVAVVVAGAAIASLPAACKSTGSNTSETASDTTSTPTGSSSTDITPPTTSSSVPATSTTALTSTAPIITSEYVPSTVKPPAITIAGTSCLVPTDRSYSTDHIWVKQLADNRVVIGISYSMFEMLNNPWKCSLSEPGATLAKGDNFGAIEGYKLAADLISPVSGTVVQINPLVVGIVDTADGALIALADPYNQGWMMVIQLSKPAELNSLLTPQKYASFVHG